MKKKYTVILAIAGILYIILYFMQIYKVADMKIFMLINATVCFYAAYRVDSERRKKNLN